ncbi:MAG: hypothetical protein OMOMHJEC_03083 [Xanthomonadales bacterium]|nr:hypothetical protein [Xanthomonadales bacterium]
MRGPVKTASLLLALLMFAGCAREPSEEALRRTLDAVEMAGEERDVGEFMEHVAGDFVGNGSEFDRSGLDRLLRAVALRHQSISVVRSGLAIEMHGDRAIVRMQILVTGGAGGLLPDAGQVFETESAWRFDDGQWKLGSASWKPAG